MHFSKQFEVYLRSMHFPIGSSKAGYLLRVLSQVENTAHAYLIRSQSGGMTINDFCKSASCKFLLFLWWALETGAHERAEKGGHIGSRLGFSKNTLKSWVNHPHQPSKLSMSRTFISSDLSRACNYSSDIQSSWIVKEDLSRHIWGVRSI